MIFCSVLGSRLRLPQANRQTRTAVVEEKLIVKSVGTNVYFDGTISH